MNKKVSQQDSKKKRRKLGFWWWSLGAVLTLATLVTCSLSFPLNNSGVASSASTSPTQISSTPSVSQLSMVAVEVSTMPSKLNYNATETISTSGGILRVVLSDYSVRYVAMNDAMIDQSRIDLSRLGTTNINVRYSFNDVTLFTSYQINVVSFDVAITKVSLDVSDVNIITDQVVTLKYLLEPTNGSIDSVVWTSNNPLIASVDEFGNVSGKSIGSTTINVSINGSFTASARVNIVAPTIAPPNTGFVNRQPSEPSGADWIPIASIKDLDMIRYENVTYTFAEGTNAAVSFTDNTPGMSGKYYLLNNINFTGFDNSGYEWAEFTRDSNSFMPLGFADFEGNFGYYHDFTGEFDGNNKSINNMVIKLESSSDYNYVGLFSYLLGAEIYDLSILGATIEQSNGYDYDYVGILAGYAGNSAIENIDISGDIIAEDNVGGVIGFSSESTFIGITIDANVSGDDDVGGVVGELVDSTMDNIVVGTPSSSKVILGSDDDVGGLVGLSIDSSISNSTSYLDVDGGNNDNVGGAVGDATGTTLLNITIDANVSGDEEVGGAVGELDNSTLNNIVVGSALSTKVIVGDEDIGGLVGLSTGGSSITNSTSYLDIVGDDEVGGLVGRAVATSISNSESHGDITGEIKFNNTIFDGSKVIGVEIDGISSIGGLVGELGSNSIITNSLSTSNITGLNFNQELLDLITARITSEGGQTDVSSVPFDVIFESIYKLGGLVGDIESYSDISQTKIIDSHSTGEVIGIKFSSVVNNLFTYNSIAYKLDIYPDPDGYGIYDIGGFIGAIEEPFAFQTVFPILISESSSTGNVYGVKFDVNTNLRLDNSLKVIDISAIGGFIGRVSEDLIIDDAISSGDVFGFFAGASSGTLLIEYIYDIGGFIGKSFKSVGNEFRITDVRNEGDVYGVSLGNTSNVNNSIDGVENIGGLIGASIIQNNQIGLEYYDFLNDSSNLGNVYGVYLNDYSGLITIISFGLGEGVGGLIGSTNSIQIANVTNGVQGITNTKVVGLRMNNYNSVAGIIDGFSKVGGLIGNSNSSKIDNAINHSDVFAAEIIDINNRQYFESNRVGGLIGSSYNDYINNSYSSGDVISLLNVDSSLTLDQEITEIVIVHSNFIGGLIGWTEYSSIIASNASGEVGGLYAVGGLVGSAYGATIRDSYSTSKVTGTSSVGGLVGYTEFGEYNKVYYLNQEAGVGVYNIKGLNDVGGLIGQGMHPFVENAYAKFNKIIANYDVGGLGGRIWNDYDNGTNQISYSSVNSFEYVYAIGSIELTALAITGFKAVGGLIGEVESVIKNAFVDVDITPTTKTNLAIGAVFGIVADPLLAQNVSHIAPTTEFGKIYYDSNIVSKVGSNELNNQSTKDLTDQISNNIISDSITDVINIIFLTTAGNWTDAAWNVDTAPNNNFMWNLDGSSLVLSDLPFFTIAATLGGVSIPAQDLNPIVIRESNSDDSTFPNLVITLTLNSNYYSYYVPSDPVAPNEPTTSIGFSRATPTGMIIEYVINSNVMTITLSSSDGLNTDLINQFSGFIYVFTSRTIPGNPSGNPSRLSNVSINLPTIMFEFIDEPLVS